MRASQAIFARPTTSTNVGKPATTAKTSEDAALRELLSIGGGNQVLIVISATTVLHSLITPTQTLLSTTTILERGFLAIFLHKILATGLLIIPQLILLISATIPIAKKSIRRAGGAKLLH